MRPQKTGAVVRFNLIFDYVHRLVLVWHQQTERLFSEHTADCSKQHTHSGPRTRKAGNPIWARCRWTLCGVRLLLSRMAF